MNPYYQKLPANKISPASKIPHVQPSKIKKSSHLNPYNKFHPYYPNIK